MVYLDNASTTMVFDEVIDAMLPFFKENYGNSSSLHSMGGDASEAVESARRIISNKLNCLPESIIFTSSATEANNLAILGSSKKTNKKSIVVSEVEHPSVLEPAKNFNLIKCPVNNDGVVDLNKLGSLISDDVFLVSVMHVNNELGSIQPIEEIAGLCKEKGVLFHCDAVQSFCKLNVDLEKTHIDFLSISSHKIHGPKGVGALFIRDHSKLSPMLQGGGQEFNLRSSTLNVPGIVGFGEAVKIFPDFQKIRDMGLWFSKEIINYFPDAKLNSGNSINSIISIAFPKAEAESLVLKLSDKNIFVSSGSACSSKQLEESHVLNAIRLPPNLAHGTIRFSLSCLTAKEDLTETINVLKELIK